MKKNYLIKNISNRDIELSLKTGYSEEFDWFVTLKPGEKIYYKKEINTGLVRIRGDGEYTYCLAVKYIKIIEEKEIKYTKFNRFEIMDI